MFLEFFYLLRQYGLDVSITEWLTFQEALSKGLHGSSVTGFYHLCRAIVCKSETEYDKFDHAFLDFFEDVFYSADGTLQTELPDAILDYINSGGRTDLHREEDSPVKSLMRQPSAPNRRKRRPLTTTSLWIRRTPPPSAAPALIPTSFGSAAGADPSPVCGYRCGSSGTFGRTMC